MVETPSVRLDPVVLDDVLATVLEQHPDAPVTALTPTGASRELPADFDPGGRPIPPVGAALSTVPADERSTVLDAWARAREDGVSVTHLRYRESSDEEGTLYLIDATHRYGVYFAVLVPEAGVSIETRPIERTREPTRMGRVWKDAVSTIVDVDAGAVELFGFSPEELRGRRTIDLVHPDDHGRAIDCWMAMLADPRGTRTVRLRHRCKDGGYMWVDVSNRNLLDAPEEVVVADIVDVSEQMATQEVLREREQLLARLTEALPLGVLQLDRERRVVFTNRRFHEIMGSDPDGDFEEQLSSFVRSDRERFGTALHDVLSRGMDQDLRVRTESPTGQVRLLQLALRTLTNGVGAVTGAVACVEDITESALLQLELASKAMHDALTGCSNRAATLMALHDLLSNHAARSGSGLALVFFDIDRFKQINDALGHAAGDEILRTVVRRVGEVVREHDLVGRLGGDEFLVVCPSLSTEEEAMAVARRMVDAVHRPLVWRGGAMDVRISTGVVWCREWPVDPDGLIAQADRAMYESKRSGDGTPVGRPARPRSFEGPAVGAARRMGPSLESALAVDAGVGSDGASSEWRNRQTR